MENEIDLLIDEHCKAYELLLEQSQQLFALVEKDVDEGELESLLKRRQETIRLMESADEKIKKAKGKPGPKEIERIGKTIEKILKLDRESSRLLEKSKSGVAEKITEIMTNITVVKGYGPDSGPGPGKFISVRK